MPDVRDEMLTVLRSAIADYKPRKKGASLYMGFENTLLIVNLQKSQWGQQYYLNVSVLLDTDTRSDLAAWPSESMGDIRFRLQQLVGEQDQTLLASLLDLERPMPISQRLPCLRDIAATHLRPIIAGLSTADGRAALSANGTLRVAHMTRRARELMARG